MIVEREPSLRPQVMAELRTIGAKRDALRDEAQSCMRDIRCPAPALGKIEHQKLEATLSRAIREYRDGRGSDGALSSAFEWLLLWCLGQCEEWDGNGEPDGLFELSTAMVTD